MKNAVLIKTIADRSGLTQANVKSVLDTLTEVSVEALQDNKTISIANLVTLKSIDVEAKSGVSFEKPWSTPAHKAVKAAVSAKYKKLG